MFVVALLAQLAPGLVAGMAQGRCAISEPDASVDVVGGHDVVKTREKRRLMSSFYGVGC